MKMQNAVATQTVGVWGFSDTLGCASPAQLFLEDERCDLANTPLQLPL